MSAMVGNGLGGLQPQVFHASPMTTLQPGANNEVLHFIKDLQWLRNYATASTAIQAAWSILVARYTDSTDVYFQATVTGRRLAVPVFVNVKWEESVEWLLEQVQNGVSQTTEYKEVKVQRNRLAKVEAEHSRFQTLVVVQESERSNEEKSKWPNRVYQNGYGEERNNVFKALNSPMLILECHLEVQGIQLRIRFDSKAVNGVQAERWAHQLEHILRQVCTENHIAKKLADIEIISEQDLYNIWARNRMVPEAVQLCVHELISEKCREQPDAPAVCAWDGKLTYKELDKLSTQLACHLVRLGVGPEEIIPLCFEKSMWVPVTMLAVMKAGGASVALDSSLPESRLRSIVQQVEPRLILSSKTNEALSGRLTTGGVAVIVPETQTREPHVTDILPSVSPRNKLYVVFTSGSTGMPKGAIVTHSNFASAVKYQQEALGFSHSSRVFDFVSYAFDVAWSNVLHTLSAGGCLCIPSNDDRRDNMVDSIRTLGANMADLTPSIAQMLQPSELQDFHTLILSGEPFRKDDFLTWPNTIKIINTYGPAECTVKNTISLVDLCSMAAIDIGYGRGVNCWVIDSVDGQKLVPIGTVGELWIEGPLVGQGYLSDPGKTAASFVEDPPWLLRGGPGYAGRHGRLYKTGDLVRYNLDGTLVFVGRKDTQVKIRGQRVELGEVEHHIRACMSQVLQVAAEVIVPAGGGARAMLAAFLVLDVSDSNAGDLVGGQRGSHADTTAAQVFSMPPALEDKLLDRLPSYMAPAVYFRINELPRTATDKLDRKRLREIGASFSAQQLAELHSTLQDEKRAPTADIERTLQNLWARILNIDPSSISLDDSFLRLGGDSITAMQVSSAARSLHINISTTDILREKTISRLVRGQSSNRPLHNTKIMQEVLEKPFGLSPIQQLYFQLQSDPNISYDQCFLLRLRTNVPFTSLTKAIDAVVRSHTILRARFSKSQGGKWEQYITNDTSNSFRIHCVEFIDYDDMATTIKQCRNSLNIERGPLLEAVLFENNNTQILFLAIHHLVIDLVSWRVILNDLEEFLVSGILPTPPLINFQTWYNMQADYASEHLEPKDIPQADVQPPLHSYWGIGCKENLQGAVVTKRVALDKYVSSAVLGSCNDAFRTRPVELLIAALIHSFSLVFPDRPPPRVFSEGHGREPWDDVIDISRTVGWFTTMFPLQTHTHANTGLLETIRQTKDWVRSLPHKGWSYFTSKFVSGNEAEAFSSMFPLEILFNYAGLYQQLERSDAFFENLPLPNGCTPASVSKMRRFTLFEIFVEVEKGCIVVSVSYHSNMYHQQRISAWTEQYKATLMEIADLLNDKPLEWTLADFPMALKSYDDISRFRDSILPRFGLKKLDDIEDIFPCSPMQEGILISQAKDPRSYRTCLKVEVLAVPNGGRVDVTRLKQAWNIVVRRHSLLRAFFVDDFPGSAQVMHVVFKDPAPSIGYFQSESNTIRIEDFREHYDPISKQKYGLQHHFSIFQLDDERVYVFLDINHTIIDGYSTDLLLRDLQAAYSGKLDVEGVSYGNFISYIEQQPQDAARNFWKEYLADVEPCLFPALVEGYGRESSNTTIEVPDLETDKIRAFCSKWEVTPATIIQTAWALVLSRYSGTRIACFGTLSSGRDIPVRGAEDIFGPLINMLTCRVRFDKPRTVMQALKDTQSDYIRSLPYQAFPLSSIHQALHLGSSALFNTILSFQRTGEEGSTLLYDITFNREEELDPTEYDIAIGAEDSGTTIRLTMNFQARCLTWKQATKLAGCLSTAISAIIANPGIYIQELEVLTDLEREQLWTWNNTVPLAVEKCVHMLITETSQKQPDAPAVCAWDGKLTYKELDELSTQLAYHLVELGVKPNQIVPVCFEKSMWMPVATLAVMKAGGASVALDSSLPEGRLQSIVQQVHPQLIISSKTNESLSGRLTAEKVAVAVPEILVKQPYTTITNSLPTVSPRDTLYVVFTSGSSGTPKGAIITHSNFASAIKYQQEALGFTCTSRVFDFASYAFDASWANTLHTLSVGACLCVPSNNDRRDNIVESIHVLGANTVNLTPSAAQMIQPSQLPGVHTLILGGEPFTRDDFLGWVNTVKIINAYGPAECTVNTAISQIDRDSKAPVDIGRGKGVNCWVTDVDGKTLVPIGAIGELWVEGPLVGQGYLSDPEKTAVSFVEDPPWLLHGGPGQAGRHGLLYKTGDLVRYNSDGTLVFIGRKDAQVKIRGQRVELGEVEHHIQQCMPQVLQLAAEVIMPAGESTRTLLAAFLALDDVPDGSAGEPVGSQGGRSADSIAVQVFTMPTALENKLFDRLPSYMVPAVYFKIKELPRTATDKIDRKQLREIGSLFSSQQLAELCSPMQQEKRGPRTETERTLQKLWSHILNINPSSIGIDDSFLRLGGDSITAMQVSAAARSSLINISTSDILREKTISRLVQGLPSSQHFHSTVALQEALEQPFELSPVQQLYFQLQPDPTVSYDQCFLLRLRSKITSASLGNAIDAIVRSHSILRARFSKAQGGKWEQYITDDTSNSFRIHYIESIGYDDMATTIKQCRNGFDIEKGPLLEAVLFENDNSQILFLAIHHLVVDLVSWRVILKDLEEFLVSGTPPAPPLIPFQTWCTMQADYAAKHLDFKDILQVDVRPPFHSYWGINCEENLQEDVVTRHITLDEFVTSAVLGSCNDAFQTRPVELLIAALIYSFSLAFPDRDLPAVFSEGHGREPWDNTIDISRTVGWFTTMFPVQICTSPDVGVLDAVRQTKDCVRNLSQNGWSYFVSNFVDESKAKTFSSAFPVEILFNFAGLYQQLERTDAFFKNLPLPEGCNPVSLSKMKRFTLFEIFVEVENGCITISIAYHRDMHHQQEIGAWVQQYEATLVEAASLLNKRPLEWTLTDFPMAFKSYDDISRFRDSILPRLGLERIDDIEDIFPCSPMQEGILISQVKDPRAYRTCLKVEVIANSDEGQVDVGRLHRAWNLVVRRHTLLRAFLLDNFPGSFQVMHVVLKDPTTSVSYFRSEDNALSIEEFREHYNPVSRQKDNLQHHLAICQLNDQRVYLFFDINHTIIDGYSKDLLLHDLQAAYSGGLDTDGVSYSDFVSYLEQQSQDAARDFWTDYLVDVEPCLFPKLVEDRDCWGSDMTIEVPNLKTDKIHAFCAKWEVTPATIIQTAWALVLSRYSGMKTACFGTLSSGRDVPVRNVENIFGPLINMLTCRVHFDKPRTVLQTLKEVQNDYIRCLPYQTFPIASVHRALQLGSSPLFNTVLSFQRASGKDETAAFDITFRHEEGLDPTEYEIAINATDDSTTISIVIDFQSKCLTQKQATGLASCLSAAISAIITNPETYIQELEVLTDVEREQLWAWNSTVLPTIKQCVHELIIETCRKQPDAPAICAWDGELTYHELDNLSTQLAHHLVELGVGPDKIVPLCFEKSMWVPVAILAVMKAGGTSVALDSSLPEGRLHNIAQQTGPCLILSSRANQALSNRLTAGEVTVAVPEILMQQPCVAVNNSLPTVSPYNMLYIVFTSGSTGTPKGAIITHSNFASAIKYQQDALGFSCTSRVFDFVSYAFDVAWSNVLHTLSAGGCLCIPSNEDRRDNMADSIRTLGANMADLTPSAAQMLQPSQLQGFHTLILSGEPFRKDDFLRWASTAKIINTYGPAECTVKNTTSLVDFSSMTTIDIGCGQGVNCWVTDPVDGQTLVPFGAVGELWIEGPLVGQGYLSDPRKTAASFIEDPPWLLRGGPGHAGRHGRLYKTGDLVRYNSNGTLVFIGRKDAQVKIRGQRVELGEVEHYVRHAFGDGEASVVAEVIKPNGSNNPMLMAFLATGLDPNEPGDKVSETFKYLTTGLEERLVDQLPAYMIPSVYIPIDKIPLTTTGKTDRRRLQEIGGSMSLEQLAALNLSRVERREPSTAVERQLQQLWASVLNINPSSIGADDSFLQIGGDSIGAMRLVGAARNQGLLLTVADVFKQPRLSKLAKILKTGAVNTLEIVKPFSLLRSNPTQSDARMQAATLCGLEASQIEDIFPCTPLQEGLLAMTARRPGDYVGRSVLELCETVNIDRFKEAWEHVVATTDILRTRIVDLPHQGLMQVVVKEQTHWFTGNSLQAYVCGDNQLPISLGLPLTRSGLVNNIQEQKYYFVLTLHHALYDGWSMLLLLEQIRKTYNGERRETLAPFQSFIKYITDIDENSAAKYWQTQLTNSEAVLFPALLTPGYEPQAESKLQYQISEFQWPRSDITAPTAVRAAWSLLLACYTNSSDVIFGATVTGRQAAVLGIELMIGPTIATVPIRIQVDLEGTLDVFLQQVQSQATEMTAFEQSGLQRIRRLNSDIKQGSQFQTLLVVQPVSWLDQAQNDDELFLPTTGEAEGRDGMGSFSTYALTLVCQLEAQRLQLSFSFDSKIIEYEQVQRISQQLEQILRQMCNKERTIKVKEIKTISEQDLRNIWARNATVPEAVHLRVDELIAEICRKQPDEPAICAWDGELTYGELDKSSTQLAHYLVELGVGPDKIIPLCFEKSMWMPISMLAVMKAGGACLALDSSLPESRLRSIVEQTKPQLILCSKSNEALSGRLTAHVTPVIVSETTLQQPYKAINHSFPAVKPWNALYVVFTSGSTGTPKGAIITHSNFASAIKYQQDALGFSCTSRVYDFASYAFDAAWSNALHTLSAGGCLCIPSNNDRRDDMADSICALRANMANLTPSIAQMLQPSQLQGFHTLILGGEPFKKDDFLGWADTARVINAYGPAECTVNSAISLIDLDSIAAVDIGYGKGVNCWVADSTDGGTLVPLGAIGELWIEGPLVGQGYLLDAEKTAASFVEDPPWLLYGGPGYAGRHGRLYKTGDLVRYNSDGTLVFVGRKDAQVKIRGQRVELSEIEYHVRRALEDKGKTMSVVAEVIRPDKSNNPMLVVFLTIGKDMNEPSDKVSEGLKYLTTGLERRLINQLPAYMIPSAYIPIDEIPMTATGKTDRRRLQEMGRSMTLEQLAALNPSRAQRREPSTAAERQLQQLWASVLGIDPNSIGADDSFLQIGGDSIGAMRLVGAARSQGLALTVADVLKQPRLSDLALSVQGESVSYQDPEPFSLIAPGDDLQFFLRNDVLPYLDNPEETVIDVLPMTYFQGQCVSAALTRILGRCRHFFINLQTGTDVQRLIDSCTKLWDYLDILRTVFIYAQGRYLQAVLRKLRPNIDVYETREDLAEFSESIYDEDLQMPLKLGRSFTRFLITYTPEGQVRLTIRLSHAQYDGLSLGRIFSCLAAFYEGQEPVVIPKFAGYIMHIARFQESGRKYWQTLLSHSQITALETDIVPARDSAVGDQLEDEIRLKAMTSAPQNRNGVTSATLFTALCACAIGRMTKSSDVLFGLVVSGRSMLQPALQDTIGPCMNVLPVRVRLDDEETIERALECVHDQRIKALPFETSQFNDIAEHCTTWPKDIEDYGFVVQFQNIEENPDIQISGTNSRIYVYERPYPHEIELVTILAKPLQDSWELDITASPKFHSRKAIANLLEELLVLIANA